VSSSFSPLFLHAAINGRKGRKKKLGGEKKKGERKGKRPNQTLRSLFTLDKISARKKKKKPREEGRLGRKSVIILDSGTRSFSLLSQSSSAGGGERGNYISPISQIE